MQWYPASSRRVNLKLRVVHQYSCGPYQAPENRSLYTLSGGRSRQLITLCTVAHPTFCGKAATNYLYIDAASMLFVYRPFPLFDCSMPKLGSPATLSRQARADKPHLRFATAADAKTEKPQREASVTIAAFSELNSATQERLSSIFQMVDHFRAMADNPDAAEMRLAAQDFNRCLEKVLRGCKDLPSTVRSGSEFQIAFRGAVFSGLGFGRHVRFVKADVYFVDAVQVSLEWLDMTVSSLKELFRVIKRLRDEHKPLPHVPSSSMPDNEPPLILEYPSSVLEEEVLLAVDPPTPIATPPEDISFVPESSYIGTEISALEATIEPVARATVVKGTLRRLVLGVARRNNLKPLTMWSNTTFSKSATTLVPSPCVAEFGGPKTPTTPSSIEHVPHGTEPASFGVKENTPPGSTVDLHFSAAGVLCAASHSGLVRVLTSMEAVTDPSLNNLFFFSFRFFSTPQAVFDALVARYNEQPPEGLAPGQSISWEDQARITRVRVAKVLLLWLRVYWRYEWDAEILEPLRQLVSSRLSTDPAAAILTKVAEQVDIASAGASYRGSRPRTRPETPPTSQHQLSFQPLCKDAMIKGAFHEVDILHFHSPEGREELVRQLCLAGSELFCAINPEDAVRYWKDNKNKQVRGIISRITVFENAIVYWVANSIVARPTVRSRAEVVEFFLDVALVSALDFLLREPLLIIYLFPEMCGDAKFCLRVCYVVWY